MLSDEENFDTATVKRPSKFKTFIVEVVQFVLIVVFIIVPFRLFVAQPFVVNGSSMDPTFSNSEYLIVDQLTYRFSEPQRGDVIIFQYPKQPSKFFIKRVIGLPGEIVEINGTTVRIINSAYPEGFDLSEPYITHTKMDEFDIKLEDDEYFVLGDNRSGSSDSRVWGPLEDHYIVGRAFLRLLPITHISLFPGFYTFEIN